MTIDVDQLADRFEALYGRRPAGAVRAPGRVNLIGEHTDYNDGFVLPIAIQRELIALYAPRMDGSVNLRSLQDPAAARLDLDQPIEAAKPAWANYCRGVAAGLLARGVRLSGADVLFASDIPLGRGLSSSAALEVATALALLAAAGLSGAAPPNELALLCQRAEHEYAGAPCGIMDQSVVVMAQAGRAMLLDCRSGQVQHVPLDSPDLIVLVADTQVRHDIADGGYGARREQCRAAARALGVPALRDADAAMVARAAERGSLAGAELLRARHVVGEIARTLEARDALTAGDYERFGRLMYASHQSLQRDFQVSCPELDAVVGAARPCAGVFGARMTGGGFGGCAIILARAEAAGAVSESVAGEFARRFGRRCPIFATRAVAGAGELSLESRRAG